MPDVDRGKLDRFMSPRAAMHQMHEVPGAKTVKLS